MQAFLILLCLLLMPTFIRAEADLEKIWTNYYNNALANHWESVSGSGSTLQQTIIARSFITKIIEYFNITSIVDAPCGDFNWMKHVDIKDCTYTGIDIIQVIIEKNNELYSSSQNSFFCKNILTDAIPYADLIICRDCLVHFTNAQVFQAIKNFKQSGAKYLLTTTFPKRSNYDIVPGKWRPINLQNPPFNFPKPLLIMAENCTEYNGKYADKSLALWELQNL